MAAESTHVLAREIAAYDAIRDELERDHLYEWVVFHDEQLIGTYEDFQDAAAEAVRMFGRGTVPHQTGWGPAEEAACLCNSQAG